MEPKVRWMLDYAAEQGHKSVLAEQANQIGEALRYRLEDIKYLEKLSQECGFVASAALMRSYISLGFVLRKQHENNGCENAEHFARALAFCYGSQAILAFKDKSAPFRAKGLYDLCDIILKQEEENAWPDNTVLQKQIAEQLKNLPEEQVNFLVWKIGREFSLEKVYALYSALASHKYANVTVEK